MLHALLSLVETPVMAVVKVLKAREARQYVASLKLDQEKRNQLREDCRLCLTDKFEAHRLTVVYRKQVEAGELPHKEGVSANNSREAAARILKALDELYPQDNEQKKAA